MLSLTFVFLSIASQSADVVNAMEHPACRGLSFKEPPHHIHPICEIRVAFGSVKQLAMASLVRYNNDLLLLTAAHAFYDNGCVGHQQILVDDERHPQFNTFNGTVTITQCGNQATNIPLTIHPTKGHPNVRIHPGFRCPCPDDDVAMIGLSGVDIQRLAVDYQHLHPISTTGHDLHHDRAACYFVNRNCNHVRMVVNENERKAFSPPTADCHLNGLIFALVCRGDDLRCGDSGGALYCSPGRSASPTFAGLVSRQRHGKFGAFVSNRVIADFVISAV